MGVCKKKKKKNALRGWRQAPSTGKPQLQQAHHSSGCPKPSSLQSRVFHVPVECLLVILQDHGKHRPKLVNLKIGNIAGHSQAGSVQRHWPADGLGSVLIVFEL